MTKVKDLKHSERIDFLFDTNLKIIQSSEVFSFSLDAVLLARFVYVPIQKGRLIDLCTGNGAIPILLTTRTKGSIEGVELQPRLYDMAVRSAALNQLDDQLTFACRDIKDAPDLFGKGEFDIVTCNPPYFPAHQARDQNSNHHLAIARHEIHTNLKEVIEIASLLLKPKGKAAFVHRPERLAEIMALMRLFHMEPKRLQFVHPKKGKAANMVLIEGTKQGKEGLTVHSPIHVYDESGSYTEDILHVRKEG